MEFAYTLRDQGNAVFESPWFHLSPPEYCQDLCFGCTARPPGQQCRSCFGISLVGHTIAIRNMQQLVTCKTYQYPADLHSLPITRPCRRSICLQAFQCDHVEESW